MHDALQSVDIKSDISASVGKLGPLRAGELSGKTEIVAQNLFSKYPKLPFDLYKGVGRANIRIENELAMGGHHCCNVTSASLP